MRFKAALIVGLLVLAITASAALAGGGRDIASAPTIAPGDLVQGYFGDFPANFDGETAEFFKLPLKAGDHVQIRVQSVGDYAPCASPFLPGTDDFTIDPDTMVTLDEFKQVNGSRFLTTFIAGQTGTYVLAMNDHYGWCYTLAKEWAYSFTVLAPHGLRIRLPRLRELAQNSKLSVKAYDALTQPVDDPNLMVHLVARLSGHLPVDLGSQPVKQGVAQFTIKLPKSWEGKRVRFTATAGDKVTWIRASNSRVYSYK